MTALLTTRREFLASVAAAAAIRHAALAAAKPMRGAFMILHTPFSASGRVDWDDLAREALFVDRAGSHGVVWPQGSSGVANLTKAERLHGMELLAGTLRGKRTALVLGVQGRDTGEMLEYARRAEALAPDAMIAMPPAGGTSVDDYRAYFRALANETRRPVILQTSGGARSLPPPVDLIVELARDFPHFGYVKEESAPVLERMTAEIAARPPMRSVFGASFANGWLYEMRLGLDGVITGNAMFADLMARMWELHERRQRDELRDAFSRFLLMRNLEEQIPGASLYVFRKRGIFKTCLARTAPPAADGTAKVADVSLSAGALAEIDYRFASLRPYLLPE
jgi:4-hydroxy-tetrahydrodipicolinate synthase